MGTEGLWNLSFCQWASAHVFLRSSLRAKNLVQFLYFRKHFHNFKYNNFLFGMMPAIIHTYIWLSFICFAPLTEKRLEEIRSRSWKTWGLQVKSHTETLALTRLVLWDWWTIGFSICGVLKLWKRWNICPASFSVVAFSQPCSPRNISRSSTELLNPVLRGPQSRFPTLPGERRKPRWIGTLVALDWGTLPFFRWWYRYGNRHTCSCCCTLYALPVRRTSNMAAPEEAQAWSLKGGCLIDKFNRHQAATLLYSQIITLLALPTDWW